MGYIILRGGFVIHSFLLIGQSNMAGRGFAEEALPVDVSNIKVLRNGRWWPFFRPVNPDRVTAGVCLAESFAERYAKEHGVEVGLIPCADGGTRIDQWKRGSLLYDHALYSVKLAERTSTIAGILWHQGEADCSDALSAEYLPKLLEFVENIKEDTGLSDVPFILGGLGDYLLDYPPKGIFKNYPVINEAMRKVADSLPMTGFVSAEGLTPNPDNLHFSAPSLYEFGLRYYEEFDRLRDKNKVFAEKPQGDFAIRTEMEKL